MEIVLRKNRLPILKTGRLVLRDIEAADISSDYVKWMNDPETIKFLDAKFAPPTYTEMVEYVLEKLSNINSCMHFGVYDSGGYRLVGTVTLPIINKDHLYAEMSFVIGHPSVQGIGYATEAVHGVTYYAFYEAGICKLYSEHFAMNEASSRVLEKNGFINEGCFKRKLIWQNNFRKDSIIKGLYIDDFIPKNDLLGDLPPAKTMEE